MYKGWRTSGQVPQQKHGTQKEGEKKADEKQHGGEVQSSSSYCWDGIAGHQQEAKAGGGSVSNPYISVGKKIGEVRLVSYQLLGRIQNILYTLKYNMFKMKAIFMQHIPIE